jgi:hypothetical protein
MKSPFPKATRLERGMPPGKQTHTAFAEFLTSLEDVGAHPCYAEALNALSALQGYLERGGLEADTRQYMTHSVSRLANFLAQPDSDDRLPSEILQCPNAHKLHEGWSALSMAYLAHSRFSTKQLRKLITVSEGKYPIDHSLPRDPYSRYVHEHGLHAQRVYATQFFTDEEHHRMQQAVHGEGAKMNDALTSEMYARSGCNSFVVSRYLQDLFAIQDIDTNNLPAPPFGTIWVQLPYSGIQFYSARTGKLVEADGFFASTYVADGVRQLIINMWAAETLDEKYAGRDSTLGMRVERPNSVINATVEEYLTYVHDTLMSRDHIPHKEQHTNALLACFRIYFHVLLYLDADLAVAKDLYASEIARVQAILDTRQIDLGFKMKRRATNREKRAAQRRLTEITKGTVHLLAPALVKGMAYSPKRLSKPHEGERAQTIVRGHYRMQPYGPRDENKRRRTYIAPHFSPKLEGDADYSALLRSKEYVLE